MVLDMLEELVQDIEDILDNDDARTNQSLFRRSLFPEEVEVSLYNWLRMNLPGKQRNTPQRWEKLNETFGEGWEMGCFPLTPGAWRPPF